MSEVPKLKGNVKVGYQTYKDAMTKEIPIDWLNKYRHRESIR